METIQKSTNLKELNASYEGLLGTDRLKKVFDSFEPDRILVTSSFGTTAAILLHQISQVAPDHPIYLTNTGYLFEETHDYKNKLIDRLGLNVVEVSAPDYQHRFTRQNDSWNYHPDLCCHINKVRPTEHLKKDRDVWVSGLMRYQNANRAKLRVFEPKDELLKFHPNIDMTEAEVSAYATIYELPLHPLMYEGFGSIGCTHCTTRGEGREGRWIKSDKTECGLHG